MADDLPTPEELGERLQAGTITREEAIEIMSLRARRDAFQHLYAPPGDGDSAGEPASPAGAESGIPKALIAVGLLVMALLVLLFLILGMLT